MDGRRSGAGRGERRVVAGSKREREKAPACRVVSCACACVCSDDDNDGDASVEQQSYFLLPERGGGGGDIDGSTRRDGRRKIKPRSAEVLHLFLSPQSLVSLN